MADQLTSQVATDTDTTPVKAKSKSDEKHMILRIKERFFKELQGKTSWGKNEVRNLYDDIATEEMAMELFRNMNLDLED